MTIGGRQFGDEVFLVGIIEPNVFHVRGIEAHVRIVECQHHVRFVERLGRVAGLEGKPHQHLEYLRDFAADGRGTHFPRADGEHDANAVREMCGSAVELPLCFVPEDVDGIVGDERSVEEPV